jgi:beta-fructofuranosidase
VLRLADGWTWDFWLADDGRHYHVYFLKAPRDIGDPELRHRNVTIGHGISTDLVQWTIAADALAPAPSPAFDDIATWTGSIVRNGSTWFMFYTGVGSRERSPKQRIGLATSADLFHWRRHPASPVLSADRRWYEQLPDVLWADEACRDPWVFPDPDGDGWHMLVTARGYDGPADQRGVIGYAQSSDLVHWHARPPLSRTGEGFGHLEVPQTEIVSGRPVLVFSCQAKQLSTQRQTAGTGGGIWNVPCQSLVGPFDPANAVRISDESLYSGRLVRNRAGQWVMLAFRNLGPDGSFVGELTDPMPVGWAADGSTLEFQTPAIVPGLHAGRGPGPTDVPMGVVRDCQE